MTLRSLFSLQRNYLQEDTTTLAIIFGVGLIANEGDQIQTPEQINSLPIRNANFFVSHYAEICLETLVESHQGVPKVYLMPQLAHVLPVTETSEAISAFEAT